MILFSLPLAALLQENPNQVSPETGMVICGLGLAAIVGLFIWNGLKSSAEKSRRANLSSGAREREDQAREQAKRLRDLGELNQVMVCPHCQTKGKVRTKAIEKKAGISGGKATAAVLTGGVSVLATGLSRSEGATQAHCDECNNTWAF
ncbi:MAG: hypothetical protein P4L50_00455 [Anaerolineaceae bacterium]|nr:hypothetical protein [Anaerolineaceae bacterium]